MRGGKNPEASGVTVHRAFNQQPSKTLWFIYLNHDTYFCRMHPIILLVFVFFPFGSGVFFWCPFEKQIKQISEMHSPLFMPSGLFN